MKKLIALACLGMAVAVSTPVFAGSQQEKMKSCNREASDKSLKGKERKVFMKDCLSAAKRSQQQKMKDCNHEASDKALKGGERKHFMSACLRG